MDTISEGAYSVQEQSARANSAAATDGPSETGLRRYPGGKLIPRGRSELLGRRIEHGCGGRSDDDAGQRPIHCKPNCARHYRQTASAAFSSSWQGRGDLSPDVTCGPGRQKL
jgi:hypothetical protein